MTDVQAHELEVAADLEAPRTARRFVAGVLGRWAAVGDLVDRAQLLVSELVSNAVQYGDGPIHVIVGPGSRTATFRVEVCNTGLGRPVVRHPATDEISGRGLQIVEELSASWGSAVRDGATSVWFEMHADAPL